MNCGQAVRATFRVCREVMRPDITLKVLQFINLES